jgi:hypothetical protein
MTDDEIHRPLASHTRGKGGRRGGASMGLRLVQPWLRVAAHAMEQARR